jgi:hypothetical protein
MCASDVARALVAALLLIGCESGPPPELSAEVAALRAIMQDDPAAAPIDEAERIATERPVHAAELLAERAIPAARRHAARAREAEVTSEEARAYQRRLAEAYAKRVRGLEEWQRYLADAATDDAALLESITTLREASVELVELDRDMDAVAPIVAPRRR